MQVAPDRISAADPEVHHAGNREHSFRDENFPKGILLPGLPFHLGKRRRSAPPACGLGDVLVTGARRGKLQAPNTKLQRSSKFQTSKPTLVPVCFGFWCLGFLWSLVLGIWSFGGTRCLKNQPRNYVDTIHFLTTFIPPHEMAFPFIARGRDLRRGGVFQLRPVC